MNKKSLIVNSCLIGLSVLTLIFLALPFFGPSGYEMLASLGFIGGADFLAIMIYIAPLFMLLASIALLAFAIVALLGNVNVIKNEKLLKAARIINLVAACVLALFALLAFVFLFVLGAAPAYGHIINTIFAVAALVGAILPVVWAKKN